MPANANIEPVNERLYRSIAADADVGIHQLASEILNLVTDCMRVTNTSWPEFKVRLPGAEDALRVRRLRRASSILTDDRRREELKGDVDLLPEAGLRELLEHARRLRAAPAQKGKAV